MHGFEKNKKIQEVRRIQKVNTFFETRMYSYSVFKTFPTDIWVWNFFDRLEPECWQYFDL